MDDETLTDEQLVKRFGDVASRAPWPAGIFVRVDVARGFDFADEPALFVTIIMHETSTEDFPRDAVNEAVRGVHNAARPLEDNVYVTVVDSVWFDEQERSTV